MFLTLNLIVALSAITAAKQVTLDCAKHVELCKADCWHRNCVDPTLAPNTKGGTNRAQLTHQGDAHATEMRKESGYTVSGGAIEPCKPDPGTGITGPFARPDQNGMTFVSIEEYPFASSSEGGYGTSLRCVTVNAQQVQGGEIRGAGLNTGDKYDVVIANLDNVLSGVDANGVSYGGVDWCEPERQKPSNCANDGYQFVWIRDTNQYVLDSRNRANPGKAKRAIPFGDSPTAESVKV